MINSRKLIYVNLLFLILFGMAFAFAEAAVVYYLRHILNFQNSYNLMNYKTLLNLGFITFIRPLQPVLLSAEISRVELAREAATIVMLLSVAFLSGRNLLQRLGGFLIAFATWDIGYYVFLKILTNWPNSLSTKDIYFLIPVVWIGPVITPIVISSCLFIVGTVLYIRYPSIRR